MKALSKRISAIALTFCLLLLAVPAVFSETKAETANYAVGDIIKFGSYPQSEVTDSSVLEGLNALGADELEWKSYGYYSGNGDYGSMTSSDYMKYADVNYNGDKYRAVKFDTYRPYFVFDESTADDSTATLQDYNGYYVNTVYWFKYEPVEWRILSPSSGLLLSEFILDSQPNSNTMYKDENGDYFMDPECTVYANNYPESSIRKWLNEDFYNTSFSETQKSKILSTVLDNSAFDDSYSQYDCVSTTDNVYLLSWNDVTNNAYGFSSKYSDHDVSRITQGSDYAKCQGLSVYNMTTFEEYIGYSTWKLRSPGNYENATTAVGYDGYVSRFENVSKVQVGIRPALRVSNISETDETTEKNTTATDTSSSATRPVETTAGTAEHEETKVRLSIKNPSQTDISYGDRIILHVIADLPAGARIVWGSTNDNFQMKISADGKACIITPEKSGKTTFMAYAVDENGNKISRADTQTMTSQASFFEKLIAFIKSIFGLNETYIETEN